MMDWLPADPGVVDAARRLLADRGVLSADQLLDALETAGVDLGDDPEVTLDVALEDEELDLAVPLADGRWVWLPTLLDGRVFTHRLTAREIAHDLLDVTPDLEPISTLTDNDTYTHLAGQTADEYADGAPVTEVLAPFDSELLAERDIPIDAVDPDGGLLLPPGCLNRLGVAAGDLVAVRVTPTGLAVQPVDEAAIAPADSQVVADGLRAGLSTAVDGPVEVADAVWAACAEHPALFTRPIQPLSAVIDAAGLAREGEWLAPAGFDFARWRTGNRLADLADRHTLDAEAALAALTTVLLYERVADLVEAARDTGQDPDPAALAELSARVDGSTDNPAGPASGATRQAVAWLADPAVAEAVLAETLDATPEDAATVRLFAETLEPLAPRAARVALRWLRGRALERLGQITEAETAYQAAESLEPTWPPVLIDLAHYAADRGDATLGLALLRRAGVPADDPVVDLLARFEATPRSDLGRNQPCWCGSGRKYKQCHLGRERAPLAERTSWLYQKAAQFAVDGAWQDLAEAVARERARYAGSPDQMMQAITDPLVIDAVLFEGGAFADFLATRGFLLPEDERLLAAQWLLVDRSVHEIQAVRPGIGLTVRDVRTGDLHDIAERTASQELTAGQLICARIVPAGSHDTDTRQIFGGIEPVSLHERDELIALLDEEPDPLDLVALLTRRFAAPTLRNTEGEPLVLCEATLRVPDPAALERALDDTYEPAGDLADVPTAEWVEYVDPADGQQIRATLRLDGDQLSVRTNSEPRLDRVLATLRAAQPAITVLSQSRQPAGDPRAARRFLEPQPPDAGEPDADPDDPEIAALLDQYIRDYEQRWLDEPIPALAGHTPRECAADPTRRDDLIRLLDSFPDGHGKPGLMRPDRIRTTLGLP